jgi:hypothetical protein
MATADGVFVFDADSHWCEPPDLFTSRAPAAVKDRVPRVEDVDGQLMWVFDGHPVGRFSAGGVVTRDGQRSLPTSRYTTGPSIKSMKGPTIRRSA